MFGIFKRQAQSKPNPRAPKASANAGTDFLVIYASQTGQAEEIARRTQARLKAGGLAVDLLPISKVSAQILRSQPVLLFIVSTTGEGDAPDMAQRFEQRVMSENLDLSKQECAVLALGNRSYDDFCGFGHRVSGWLEACNANILAPCLEVDDLEPAVLGQWDRFLDQLGAGSTQAVFEQSYDLWRLEDRICLNPESPASRLYQLDFKRQDDVPNPWDAGDLAEIKTPSGHRRDYSIATLPQEGGIRLWVRQIVKPDGSLGEGSGWLTSTLQTGELAPIAIKSHTSFHFPGGSGPILLVGAGSGLAGLRPHILEAQRLDRPCWVIYGERDPDKDGALCRHLEALALHRLDIAFSRPTDGKGRYVQDIVSEHAKTLSQFLSADGAVMVCGNLDMGKAVGDALKHALGGKWLEGATDAGRYRRDLY